MAKFVGHFAAFLRDGVGVCNFLVPALDCIRVKFRRAVRGTRFPTSLLEHVAHNLEDGFLAKHPARILRNFVNEFLLRQFGLKVEDCINHQVVKFLYYRDL
jgi:hypothetical protein